VHADLGGDPGDDEARDAVRGEDVAEVGGVERALAGLVDDRLAVDRVQLVDDVVTALAADEDAAVGARAGVPRGCGRRTSRPPARPAARPPARG
jgi:hypothetical protein